MHLNLDGMGQIKFELFMDIGVVVGQIPMWRKSFEWDSKPSRLKFHLEFVGLLFEYRSLRMFKVFLRMGWKTLSSVILNYYLPIILLAFPLFF
jgi:hypothetical protein